MTHVKTWGAGFEVPIKAKFFGAIDVGRNIPNSDINRKICMDILDDIMPELVTPYQMHTSNCHFISTANGYDYDNDGEADALVTDKAGFAIGVVTADCVPILFSGVKKDDTPIIGAAHAGARGALKGIVQNTVAMMREHDAVAIKAAIGPCIQQKSYQVGAEFMDEFVDSDPATYPYFKNDIENGKYLFDVQGYVMQILESLNVVYASVDVDTYTSPDCFSYRRATHQSENTYGRQLSAIMICD